jgi:3-deoxy-manno-octulosonate cytidylyltransferase (CMP-KDO synthetase)
MKALIVVPSRLGSTRFPAKVLAKLDGKPIVQWCWEAASAAGDAVIATESSLVVDAVESFGGKAVLTSDKCQSGTDRVYEAARHSKAEIIINMQGDSPFMKTSTIKAVVDILKKNKTAEIATAVMPLTEDARVNDPNVVKAVMSETGRCLYFSRSPIPFPRLRAANYWEHLGIYGFRRASLEKFVKLPPSPLELTESLEQLRALEAGMTIFSAVVSDVPVAIDTPADLIRAESLLSGRKK